MFAWLAASAALMLTLSQANLRKVRSSVSGQQRQVAVATSGVRRHRQDVGRVVVLGGSGLPLRGVPGMGGVRTSPAGQWLYQEDITGSRPGKAWPGMLAGGSSHASERQPSLL